MRAYKKINHSTNRLAASRKYAQKKIRRKYNTVGKIQLKSVESVNILLAASDTIKHHSSHKVGKNLFPRRSTSPKSVWQLFSRLGETEIALNSFTNSLSFKSYVSTSKAALFIRLTSHFCVIGARFGTWAEVVLTLIWFVRGERCLLADVASEFKNFI